MSEFRQVVVRADPIAGYGEIQRAPPASRTGEGRGTGGGEGTAVGRWGGPELRGATFAPPHFASCEEPSIRVRHTGAMITMEDFFVFVDEALDGMAGIVRELGDDRANRAPELPAANSAYAILTHCLGVMEWWGGHIVAGRGVERDRAAEFSARGQVDEIVERVARARQQLRADVATADPSAPPRVTPELGDADPALGKTQGGALMHIYEELAQHRGHMEITRDLVTAA